MAALAPLAGCRVIERSRSVAAAYAGRMLATMGAQVIMAEPRGGSPLRNAAPIIEQTGESALFAYLAAGKHSIVCDPLEPAGRALFEQQLDQADILIDDTPLRERRDLGLESSQTEQRFPKLVHVSLLPFGSSGPKADWDGEEVNLLHSAGEGFLLPNGLSVEMFPDRPPLKIYGHFACYQGGAMAALSALAAWWAIPKVGGQYVDVSVQDATLAVGAFALQRLGDGSLEHRKTRSFRYGGVFEAKGGFIELLTLEEHQWNGLVELLGSPVWAKDPSLHDPLERSRRGAEINRHIREWMAINQVDDIVHRAQQLSVPAAKYRTPAEVVEGEHERSRGLFEQVELPSGLHASVLLAPFRFLCSPLSTGGKVPCLGSHEQESAP